MSKKSVNATSVKIVSNLKGFKKIEFDNLPMKDKKAYSIVFSLANKDVNKWVTIPLASAVDAENSKRFSVSVETLLKIGYSLSKENIVIRSVECDDKDGKHLEYQCYKITDTTKEHPTFDADAFNGKVNKGDLIRPSSATSATSATSTDSKASDKKASDEAEKDADFIDDKIKAILKDITDIIPSYAKIEPLMLTKFMDKVKESLEKNLK
jgi:hypothetical protein